ncbi:hypothetical protein BN970_01140 [Mycolicibacterium conceptionense]|uniref:Uncharacterized protein n=1 Tax=Mycolicibacterium conceptionense TaxID=451644 RepID=A0A0U1D1B8_9MYCO|nr:hypothetical protein BN970_01140 [Mycolicibacterium conceptionense]
MNHVGTLPRRPEDGLGYRRFRFTEADHRAGTVEELVGDHPCIRPLGIAQAEYVGEPEGVGEPLQGCDALAHFDGDAG